MVNVLDLWPVSGTLILILWPNAGPSLSAHTWFKKKVNRLKKIWLIFHDSLSHHNHFTENLKLYYLKQNREITFWFGTWSDAWSGDGSKKFTDNGLDSIHDSYNMNQYFTEYIFVQSVGSESMEEWFIMSQIKFALSLVDSIHSE